MCLDDEVKRHANVKGVRYLYWHNRATVERAIVEATLLIGETFAFTSLARKNGIAPIFPLRHSIALLAALQEQAALTVVGPKRSNALKWSASYEIDRAESARRR